MKSNKIVVLVACTICLVCLLFLQYTASAQISITVKGDSIIHTMQGGIGATFYPMNDSIPVTKEQSWGGSTWGGVPDSKDTSAWNQIYAHLNWLGFDWCRVELEHRLFEPEAGIYTFHQREMENLYRFLDYCEEKGVDVFLQERYPNVNWLVPPPWRGNDIYKVRSAPNNLKAWANGMAVLMQYLIKEKKYTCIKYLCIANEPEASWSWWKTFPYMQSMSITPALKLVRQALDKAQINIPLSGPDWSIDKNGGYRKLDFNQYVGAYDLHAYNTKPDWWTKPFKWELSTMTHNEAIFKPYIDTAHNEGKPFFLTEFGSFFQGFDATSEMVTDYYSLLKDIQMVVRFSNLGVDAFNKWSFLNRGDLDGKWQCINTWDDEAHQMLKTFTPRKNQYYMYGLLTRLTTKYSKVVATTVSNASIENIQRVYATTYKSKNGNYSIVIVNDSDSAFAGQLHLQNIALSQPLYQYLLTPETTKDKVMMEINPTLFTPELKEMNAITIPPQSMLVISTYQLKHSDNGLVY